ncbi:MAG TPA: universal stress protein [Chloroflexota bacterium]|nr:universal stress protein [Chloroflexota bacterium]
MKLIAACDEHDLTPFLANLARAVPLAGADVLLVHVINSTREEDWQRMAGHHWLGRYSAPRHERVREAETQTAREILDEAVAFSQAWPAASRRAVDLQGNPERELVRLALAEHVDLLAVGQHRVELGPHAIGRCARFVIDHAPCSVLLVRAEPIRAAAAELLGHRLDGPRKERGHP